VGHAAQLAIGAKTEMSDATTTIGRGGGGLHAYFLVVEGGSSQPQHPPRAAECPGKSKIKARWVERVGLDATVDSSGTCSAVPSTKGVYHPTAEVRGTRSGLARIRGDCSVGGSGGPWFYTQSSVPRIIAVQSFNRDEAAGTGFVGGSRDTEFRDWVISFVRN